MSDDIVVELADGVYRLSSSLRLTAEDSGTTITASGAITGAQFGLCLDATGAGTAPGARINLWSCHGGANQQWALR